MKKILFFTLLTLLTLYSNAAVKVDGIYYNFSGSNAEVTSGSPKYSGDVVIPNTVTYNGKTYSVTKIGQSAFFRCSDLTSVSIPNSVTDIDNSAFFQCTSLTTVTIPNSVKSIGKQVFQSCSGLTSVNIQNGVTRIGEYMFSKCTGLTSVTLPNSVTYIGEYAFSGCSNIESVTLPSSITNISRYVFCECSSLTSINIPTSLQKIENGVFSKCSGMTTVTIPNSVTSIGSYAFEGCIHLESVSIPNSVTGIGEYAFDNCSSLTSITLPTNLKSIKDRAFGYCTNLASIIIPNSVTSIGYSAFNDCRALASLVLSENLTKMGFNAFAGCKSLKAVMIPKSLSTIGSGAFSGCTGLTSITIQDGVTNIGEYMFSGCTSITSISFPNSVTSIGEYAFSYCSGLASVTFGNGLTSIGDYAFRECNSLSSITFPSTVTTIGNAAFAQCYISVICYATTPPATGPEYFPFSTDGQELYVPQNSIELYRQANGWKNFTTISSVEELDKYVKLTEYGLNIRRRGLVFFDYDGDGVMEMFGQYSSVNKTSKKNYALMSDDAVLKIYDDNISIEDNRTYKQSATIGWPQVEGRHVNYANGSGRILLGNMLEDGATWNEDYIAGGESRVFDVNNDGRMDFVYKDKSTKKLFIIIQQADGTFLKTEPQIVEEMGGLDMPTSRANGPRKIIGMSASDALSFNNVVSGRGSSAINAEQITDALDLNGDGRLDLFTGKSAYISVGENAYCPVTFTGVLYPCDLDGDGIQDYLFYDENNIQTIMSNADGTSTQKTIFSNTCVKKFLTRDFDHDGDIDVMVYIVDTSNTYFVFLRNDGNGTFKKKETYIEKPHSFIECKDYDADGLYELYISPRYNGNNTGSVNKIVKVNNNFTLTDVSENIKQEKYLEERMYFGDFDNDGFTDFKLAAGYIPLVKPGKGYNQSTLTRVMSSTSPYYFYATGHYSKQTQRNTAPKKMSQPSLAYDEGTGFLRIIWQRGEDAETSACDLTYEVRIGTSPGKGDVLCVPSREDGIRRIVADGAMGTQMQTLFNIAKHPAGTYYVAVQAIDAGGMGGEWSDEVTYTNNYAIPTLMTETDNPTTADTITVAAGNYVPTAVYNWTVTNGDVVSQDGCSVHVIFHAAGKQQVILTTQLDGAEYRSVPLDLYVLPSKENNSIYGNYGRYFPYIVFDLNQDGYPDGLYPGTSYVTNKISFFAWNDGKGNLSKYPKSFNADLMLKNPIVLDMNLDGFPDVIGEQYKNYNNVFINDEEGDFECEQRQFTTSDGSNVASGEFVDFTNTGQCDCFYYSRIYSTTDYTAFNLTEKLDNDGSLLYDVNRDGFMDIVTRSFIYLNQGNRSFREITLHVGDETQVDTSYKLADLNNDGIVDIITSTSGKLNIFCGECENEEYRWEFAKSIKFNLGSYVNFNDLDNNGYLDIWTNNSSANVLFFDKNLVCWMSKMNYPGISDKPFVVMDGDGYPQMMYSTIHNEKPKAPSAVSVRQTVDGMVINWTDAEDDHTPAVQMRYNVSVKRKGKTGAGSYVISPMNGGDSQAALVFPWYYKQSTTMTVPSSALTAGETYEVQVQAIDLWNQWSPMTEPVEITIAANSGDIKAPDFACIGHETAILFTGVLNGNPTIDFGEGSNYTRDGSTFRVIWSSEGVKDITIGTQHSQIIVKRPIVVTFTLPEDIYTGAELSIALSEEMVAQVGKGYFKVTQAPKNAKYTVEYKEREGKAVLTVNKPGYYEVEAGCDDDLLGNSLVQSFNAKEMPRAKLQFVDAEDDHYVVNWNTSGLPASVDRVIIYREGNRQNQYLALDTVPVSNGNYVDYTSSAQMVASRYKIGLLSRGGQIFESTAHKPLHVMIGVSALGGYNLIWNPYEGMMVDNYRIWRGTSVDNMELLTQVAGSQQSFTDINAPSGEVFYAISFSPAGAPRGSARRAPIATGDVCSNILSTQSAVTMVLANSLSIVTLTDNLVLTDDNRYLQLYYLLLPTYSSYRNVAWSIVEGSDIATVSSDGLLTATGGIGNVRVRVSSLDGSELTDEINIYVQCEEYLDPDRIESIEHSPLNNEYSIYDLNGRKLVAPQKGINIIRYSDGTTRKVLVE